MKLKAYQLRATRHLHWVPAIMIAFTYASAAAEESTAPAPLEDRGWPREITHNKMEITCYQPQIDEWQGYRTLHARLAVSLTPPGEPPALGVVEITGETVTDTETRTVVIRQIKVTSARFNNGKPEDATRLAAILTDNFPTAPLTVSLDRLLAGVKLAKGAAAPVEVKMDPPPIFISTTPAMILMVEGQPVLSPVAKTGAKFVVNTNWDVFFDEQTKGYYLLSGDEWLTATDLNGPWSLAESLPDTLNKLPDDDTWKHVRQELPWSIKKGMILPKVFYSDKPAELIVFQGDPVWDKIEGTSLEAAENSDSHVFRSESDGSIYYLVSGRWFKAPKLGETWTYAGNNLPDDFRNLPDTEKYSEVSASVPGTEEAEDAVILASVPVEAVIQIKAAEAKAKVSYHGNPAFEGIEGTSLRYATNTESDVILYDGKYYLCQDALWFISATSGGPWKVCKELPTAIYSIPPSSPIYRVTYVHVEEDEDDKDDHVTSSYTAGYFGAFVAGLALGECLVWGTGYYYPPYIGWGPYPAYYPYHYSYGVAAAYNPWTGGYAIGSRVYGPYASAGRAAWYNPATGRYGRAAQVVGPYGARTVAGAYNPRNGSGWVSRQGNNGYAQWGASAASRGNKWIESAHVNTRDGGAAAWRSSEGAGRFRWSDEGSSSVAVHNGDFYAGHDGNVYRKENGQWSKWDNGGWQPAGHDPDGIRPPHDGPGPKPGPEPHPGPAPAPRPEPPPHPDRNGFVTGETRHAPPAPEGTRPGANGGGVRKPEPPTRPVVDDDNEVRRRLDNDSSARQRGNQRTQEFQTRPFTGGDGGFQRSRGGFRRR